MLRCFISIHVGRILGSMADLSKQIFFRTSPKVFIYFYSSSSTSAYSLVIDVTLRKPFQPILVSKARKIWEFSMSIVLNCDAFGHQASQILERFLPANKPPVTKPPSIFTHILASTNLDQRRHRTPFSFDPSSSSPTKSQSDHMIVIEWRLAADAGL
jgi:hypothetical protein